MPFLTGLKVEADTKCYHCGDRCDQDAISLEGNSFCCAGCKTVFEILSESDLLDYYSLDSNPGVSWKSKEVEKYFDFLTNPEIEERLLDFSSASLKRIRLFIPAIHCSSCIWLLENLYKLQNGVLRSTVNFPRKELVVDFDPATLSLSELVKILVSIGYEPVINLESAQGKTKRLGQRNFYVKLGVAGFAFANIMLLSFPEYLGLTNELFPGISRFISYVILALSLPVVLFSAADYYLSALQGLRHRFINIDVPITLGVLTLFGRSLFEIISQSGPGYLDSLSGLVFFLLVGRWYQTQTYQGLAFDRDYKSFFPLAVNRIKDNEHHQTLVQEIEVGDILLIRNRELIPCDSLLLSPTGNIDYSFVTGESEFQTKNEGERIYAGGRPVGASVKLEVLKTVSQSNLTSLWNNQVFEKPADESTQLWVNRISKYFTLAILGLAFGGFAVWLPIDHAQAFLVFTAVLIVACPCALALAAPFTLGSTLRVFGRNSFYLKNVSVIEKLNRITEVIFDKTGTITYSGQSKIHFDGEPLTGAESVMLGSLAFQSTHPLSQRISHGLFLPGSQSLKAIDDFQEIEGKGIMGSVEGQSIRLGSYSFVHEGRRNGNNQNGDTRVYLTLNGVPRGNFLIRNQYRSGLQSVIERLAIRFKLGLISGDNQGERSYLTELFPGDSDLQFGLAPAEKLEYVSQRQEVGKERVLYFGDGLNDAGALQESYLGVAINESTASFTPSSDAILLGDHFNRIPDYLRFARSSKGVVIASFVLSFLYNIVGLTFALTGNLTPLFAAILMPLSSVTVVVFATVCIRVIAKRQKLT